MVLFYQLQQAGIPTSWINCLSSCLISKVLFLSFKSLPRSWPRERPEGLIPELTLFDSFSWSLIYVRGRFFPFVLGDLVVQFLRLSPHWTVLRSWPPFLVQIVRDCSLLIRHLGHNGTVVLLGLYCWGAGSLFPPIQHVHSFPSNRRSPCRFDHDWHLSDSGFSPVPCSLFAQNSKHN